MPGEGDHRRIEAREPADPPGESLALAYAAMLPLVAGALAVWLLPRGIGFLALNAALLFGAALLAFFAGVRRGVSFRQPGGTRAAQIATTLWLFLAGLASLFAVVWDFRLAAGLIEMAGFASLAVLDPAAARRGEAPLFFARLRPLQMTLAVASLASLAVFLRLRGGL